MSGPYSVSKLTKSDKPLFVTLMRRAFARDPLFLHIFGDSEQDRRARGRVEAFVSFLFDKSLLFHEEEVWGVFENERLLGTYLVEKPPTRRPNVSGVLFLTMRLIPLLFQISTRAVNLLNSYMHVTRSAAPSVTHHYLIMIGVQPEAQGKGIGRVMLQHLLDTVNADKNSCGIALDTENKENVHLYQRFGFTLNKETQFDNLSVYCMFHQKISPENDASTLKSE
ncbi:GNAT family N-acetyltransferase [Paenibacillus guangzhouensis]|uniref:GNAT family N-acetyltransferase n=1 Tax=Paenibacillus guangzhouensis TaxID=1473112 RepID=UPI0012675319|nr:GNAT family N-acetyltransferase [Paenibacillus guangzhouensis]